MSGTERSWRQVLPWMTGFAIAMAFLESAVVVDLRALYYPTSFTFPLAPIDRRIAITELVRELATMVMLLAPGALLTRSALLRFAWFIYCFGVWDIFYYVFLKVILDWPATLFDWDILFLVPVPWVGPVLAPVIVSCGMIAFGLLVLHHRSLLGAVTIRGQEWGGLLLAALVMLYTFIEEPMRHVVQVRRGAFSVASSGDALGQLRDYIPDRFQWPVFLAGAVLGAMVLLRLRRRWSGARVAS